MIHVIVSVGSGNRKAAVITDPLIPDDSIALIRGKQELAKSAYMTVTRTLNFPHEPAGSHAMITDNASYQPLGIFGRHVITSRTISLTPTQARDTVTLEQYRMVAS